MDNIYKEYNDLLLKRKRARKYIDYEANKYKKEISGELLKEISEELRKIETDINEKTQIYKNSLYGELNKINISLKDDKFDCIKCDECNKITEPNLMIKIKDDILDGYIFERCGYDMYREKGKYYKELNKLVKEKLDEYNQLCNSCIGEKIFEVKLSME